VGSPVDEYNSRKTQRERAAADRERAHVHLGNAKVALFLAAVVYGGYALGNDPSTAAFAIGAVVFIALSVWHESVMRALARARAAVAYYEQGIARIGGTWMREDPSGERFRDRDHPYADDLDIFGRASLFQLVSSCRTPMGEQRLADWLLHASPVAGIRDRQARIAALRAHIDLRERIAVVNAGRRRSIDTARLLEWAEQGDGLPPVRALVVFLTVAFVAALVIYMNGGPGIWLAVVPFINLLVLGWLAKRCNAVVESLAASTDSSALELISNVIVEIERETFDAPALVALSHRLTGGGSVATASAALGRLARIADWADSRHNVFLRLAEIPMLFTPQLAYAADTWRRRHGRRLRDWVNAIGEMEALLSLAGYSYEHPEYPFAEIDEGGAGIFDGTEIAHPLLPASAISNSVRLQAVPEAPSLSALSAPSAARVLILSGSNMAGKSTLMRTVGINAVLALAGAPVRAQHLRVSVIAVGTCLRHTDSLQEHRSGFYTEALRIRLVCDLLDGPRPLLFLFDELLSGTNSKDRRVAAEGVVRTMVGRGAIGMVTTHDLSLTEIAALFPGQVSNVHLQDKVENGQMSFDYKLRDGVITHSNALELMRMIGLHV
jgi:MutS domain V